MLKATLEKDTSTMEEILEYAHNTETPILSYNNEVELSSIVNLVYLCARDRYQVEREDKAGLGFVDFIFYPENPADTGIILELKVDHTADEAVQQIIDKKYSLRFSGKAGEKAKYTGEILAVGIGYNKKTKKIISEFEDLNIPQAKGNVIFPNGNAVKYLSDYFDKNKEYINPYEENPIDVRTISFSKNGDVLNGNIYEKSIMEIIEEYKV